ncbi:MAG: bifunctional lysine ketoglutarate reductase /saccharopine dehydrogenase family protein [Bacteroidales bacterium]
MNNKIGIRHEDKYTMERRTPLPPHYVKRLTHKGIKVYVESSPKRVFTDSEYKSAGAVVTKSLADCPVIFGVKEMPVSFFESGKTYVFFSHVIKGQFYNMPMLRKMMEKKCNLIDYEKIADDAGRRLIFFGRYAGLAGMINSLWSLGQRLKHQGLETPFLRIRQSYNYRSLADAEQAVREVGELIRVWGLPDELMPFTIGFTGYGNVSQGAQHIANLLPAVEITPEELLNLKHSGRYSNRLVYKVVFKEEDLSKPKDPDQPFELQDYYAHPEKYQNQFEQFAPHLSVLMNCMYWDDRYPRLITKDFMEKMYLQGNMKLKVIGDVTCDPDGSIEFTHKGTEIEDPVFVYDPLKRKPAMGFQGDGILVMAVDILPSELPRESSESFGEALVDFVPAIAKANYDADFENVDLPPEIKRATILHQGKLTPDYQYIEEYLK